MPRNLKPVKPKPSTLNRVCFDSCRLPPDALTPPSLREHRRVSCGLPKHDCDGGHNNDAAERAGWPEKTAYIHRRGLCSSPVLLSGTALAKWQVQGSNCFVNVCKFCFSVRMPQPRRSLAPGPYVSHKKETNPEEQMPAVLMPKACCVFRFMFS